MPDRTYPIKTFSSTRAHNIHSIRPSPEEPRVRRARFSECVRMPVPAVGIGTRFSSRILERSTGPSVPFEPTRSDSVSSQWDVDESSGSCGWGRALRSAPVQSATRPVSIPLRKAKPSHSDATVRNTGGGEAPTPATPPQTSRRAFSEADIQSRRCSASPSGLGSQRFSSAAPSTRHYRPI
jgi:hypothetical protein